MLLLLHIRKLLSGGSGNIREVTEVEFEVVSGNHVCGAGSTRPAVVHEVWGVWADLRADTHHQTRATVSR